MTSKPYLQTSVIIGHSQLEKIPLSKERQERLLNEQIWEITDGIDELKRNNGERFTIKQLDLIGFTSQHCIHTIRSHLNLYFNLR